MEYNSSVRAEKGFEQISFYLEAEFGERFAKSYYIDFENNLELMVSLPYGFPVVNQQQQLCKLVFRKRTTIYYRVLDFIEVIVIIDNRQDFKV